MWTSLKDGLKGWRTIIAATVTALLGFADLLGAIDLRPLVQVVVHGDEAQVGAVMTLLAVLFGVLRLITTGPVGGKEPR